MERGTVRVDQLAQNEMGAPPDDDLFGIEIEVEGFDPLRRGPEASALSRYWNIKEDGSLRNNGAEFVSKLLPADKVPNAVHHMYSRTRKLWEPSIRTGIHIHANMLGRTLDDVRRVAAYYSFVEPLLFQFVGEEREENIYCVPFYRAPSEAATLMDALTKNEWLLRESCKYSALFVGPLRTFGTIEFRHAPTFDSAETMVLWWKLCRCVANSWKLRDPFEVYAEGGCASVVAEVFGDLWDRAEWSAEDMNALIEGAGADEVAFLFQPSTYYAESWGEPGKFFINEKLSNEPTSLFDRLTINRVEPQDDEFYIPEYSESEESDEEE